MAVRITDACVSCGACVWECPTEAIRPGDPRPSVRGSSCTECYGFFGESQCVVVCPADAIRLDAEPLDALAGRFAEVCPGAPAQDTWIWRRVATA